MDKKGISPLIATVLIIGFTVALAAVILIWGQGFTKSMQQNVESSSALVCANEVAFSVDSVCQCANNSMMMLITNDGEQTIDNLTVTIFKTAVNAWSVQLDDPISSYAVETYSFPAVADVKKLEVRPTVKVDGEVIVCRNNIERYEKPVIPYCDPVC